MPAATSLRDLMRIRAHNRAFLDSINGNLGTALGFRKPTGQGLTDQPAIIVFVPLKINPKWIPQSQMIPDTLQGPDGLSCALDDSEERSWPSGGAAEVELRNATGLAVADLPSSFSATLSDVAQNRRPDVGRPPKRSYLTRKVPTGRIGWPSSRSWVIQRPMIPPNCTSSPIGVVWSYRQ